ncbi:MAG: hypothetical protein HOI59_07870 [Nitrospina sp.]|nr:hypothetical protein [Nitrospina sp.]MBT3416264.1 hypothetical protein [Nitrospina sp.]MBT3855769.1 hypothetical protein [Nitrospina sp.]MBT4388875.1 hypothetical protein [Nitrospina sp.]MBT4620569.1 hypothetical protein [Nitrospina sp.]
MRDPKRILQKLLGPEMEVEPFAGTGEPLEQTVETLRDVVKCRKIREFALDHFGFDLAISPEVFYSLLDIPQINYIETTKRDLEVETVSLKENREPDDPVTISNLNSVLRELYASLFLIKERLDIPNAVLIREIHPEHIDRVQQLAKTISVLHGNLTGYLLTGWKAGRIEKEFMSLFPKSAKAHPLRSTFPLIEHELELYREVLKVQKKWEPLQLDLFAVLRKEDGLSQLLENIQELGNRLWQIIYQSSDIRQCVDLAGIDFGDIWPLFDNDKINLNPLG